jgi:transcription antitermination factor NusG
MAMITKWAFEWNEGMITDVNESKGLVKVNINLLWRDTPIELDFSQIVVK